jgi:hypothetical protein
VAFLARSFMYVIWPAKRRFYGLSLSSRVYLVVSTSSLVELFTNFGKQG